MDAFAPSLLVTPTWPCNIVVSIFFSIILTIITPWIVPCMIPTILLTTSKVGAWSLRI